MRSSAGRRMRRRTFLYSIGFAAGTAAYFLFRRFVSNAGSMVLGGKCSYCGMEVKRLEFAAEMIVDGRRLVYDDVGCMLIHYLSFKGVIQSVQGVWPVSKIDKIMVYSFDGGGAVEASSAWYVKGSDIITPMRHGLIAFKSFTSAVEFARKHGGDVVGWDAVVENFLEVPYKGHEAHGRESAADAFKIKLKTLDGREITVSEVLSGGKPVLLVFFATWCPTCSKNVTSLSNAYKHFQHKVTVFLTSFDPGDTAVKIQRFLEQHNASSDWIVTHPNLEFLVALRVITQETIFGIASSGEILYEKRFGTLTEDDWLRIVELLTS
ncbi:MAG: nitrous oxide reductase accessory protein NosL [Candidatus Caldarchaeum sp.]